jgi:Ni/Co efflux regulator RcnB
MNISNFHDLEKCIHILKHYQAHNNSDKITNWRMGQIRTPGYTRGGINIHPYKHRSLDIPGVDQVSRKSKHPYKHRPLDIPGVGSGV